MLFFGNQLFSKKLESPNKKVENSEKKVDMFFKMLFLKKLIWGVEVEKCYFWKSWFGPIRSKNVIFRRTTFFKKVDFKMVAQLFLTWFLFKFLIFKVLNSSSFKFFKMYKRFHSVFEFQNVFEKAFLHKSDLVSHFLWRKICRNEIWLGFPQEITNENEHSSCYQMKSVHQDSLLAVESLQLLLKVQSCMFQYHAHISKNRKWKCSKQHVS
jgi:hypothetical protein